MFIGPYSDGGDFRYTGIEGMFRFIRKVYNLLSEAQDKNLKSKEQNVDQIELNKLDRVMSNTIKEVTQDISEFKYNTCIARLMEYYNALHEFYTTYHILDTKYCKAFLLLLAPFSPHMTEELWQKIQISDDGLQITEDQKSPARNASQSDAGGEIRNQKSIHLQSWPEYDEKYLESDTVVIPVQINGKRRGEITVQSSNIKDQSEIESLAKESVAKNLEGLTIKKVIYIEGKIVNFVV